MSEDSLNEKVFRFLEGEWGVRRSFAGSYEGIFAGKAFFTAQQDEQSTYLYTEAGKLTDADGQLFDAKQSYLYRLAETKLEVHKRDASEWITMHELDFEWDGDVACASHLHLCGQDEYTVEYRVNFSGSWEQAYTVTGPKKDYQIRSDYAR